MSSHALSSETAVSDVVRHALGARASVRFHGWHVRRENYVVVSVETQRPTMRLIVKLEQPGERPNRHFDAMAAIARLVRSQTCVPTFEVVAVDVSRQTWPWTYLIVTEVRGATWHELYPRLDTASRLIAQRQIGTAAAQLHALRFDAFGHIGADGAVVEGATVLPALERRARQRLTTPRFLRCMLEVLDRRAHLFDDVATPTLCHEDLNSNNLVFEVRNGRPELTGILDFESAWASTGESDLARLELWRLSAGAAVREGYAEVAPVAATYGARRPLLQLLWCLEFAQDHRSADHQLLTDSVCDELAVARIQFG